MTYQATLDYMYSQLPMFTRIGKVAFKKDLTNTLALCEALGQPQNQFPTIHVAGTNGKGSTSHLLAAVLQSLGLKVGLYVSPHYRDFRERIKINGQYVPKKWVTRFVKKNQKLFTDIKPSFFEMTVAMAFDYFATEGVDIAVVEVGLGGRLDSTNIISPLVSVITNISFDHMDMLGDTLPKIAFEKAGIIKPQTPVVIGEEQAETTPVFIEKARECEAPIYFASQNYAVSLLDSQANGSIFQIENKKTGSIERLYVNLNGAYQAKNIATTLQTVEVMKELPFFSQYTPDASGQVEGAWQQAIESGFAHLTSLTQFIGRWQVLGQSPTILCDSAHNEAGIKLAMAQLKALKFNQLHFVFGMVADKDISKVLSLLPTEAQYYFCKANIPRGLDAHLLKNQAETVGLMGKTYPSVKRALAAAKKQAQADDLIYVGGSIFVLAEVI